VEGYVIKLGIGYCQNLLSFYLDTLIDAYLELKPIGQTHHAPFLVRIEGKYREPDLQVILNTNPNPLTQTKMDGAADLCVEVVSEDSIERDYSAKYGEYQRAGVQEYWIVDPLVKRSRFFQLDQQGVFIEVYPDEQGNYRSRVLPGLVLHVPTLWEANLPGPGAIVQAVQSMLKETG